MSTEKPKARRLKREVHDLYAQLYLGTIVGPALRAVVNAAAILGVGFLLSRGANLWAPESCAAACLPQGAPPARCCPYSLFSVLGFAFFLLIAAAGSMIGTKLVHSRKLQHSSMTTAFVIIVAALFLGESGFPAGLITAVCAACFFVMFYGYRRSFTKRNSHL